VPVSDELLQDAPALTRWLQSKVPEKFGAALNAAIINGSGVGQPLGILNNAAKITQTAVAGQGAGTIVATNIAKMWGRLYGPLRREAVWLISQDAEPILQTMVMPGASPAYPVYLPPGGFSSAPYSTIYGRPAFIMDAC
jgi:HK97 family phage major capsid protein